MQKIQNGLLSRYDKIPERRLSFFPEKSFFSHQNPVSGVDKKHGMLYNVITNVKHSLQLEAIVKNRRTEC